MAGPQANVLIVGAGAVGAFYGSRMTGCAVSAVCRSNYKAVVDRPGFLVQTQKYGEYVWKPAHVFDSPKSALRSGIRWDYVVVTTKALPDVQDDTETVADLVTPQHTAIVLIQNGVGVEEPYRARWPLNPILSAVTVVSAAQNSPGVITHNRWTRISIGPYSGDDALPAEKAASRADAEARDGRAMLLNVEFCRYLQDGGISDAEVYDEADLQLVRWHKICINASMNPSAVLTAGCGNAEMALDPELRLHLKGVMEEVLTTAPKVLGRPFPAKFATADKILKSTERNAGGKPSMLLDWQRGNPMEVEVILGNPVKIARRKGFDMPRTQSLYALLRMAGERRRKGLVSKL